MKYFGKQFGSCRFITVPQAETASDKIMAYYMGINFFHSFP